MGLEIKSRKNKNSYYCFSDRSPDGLIEDYPHLVDNFSFDPRSPIGNSKLLDAVLKDCVYPGIEALYESGVNSVIRFIKSFGIRATPLYIYTINTQFYTQQRKSVT